VEEGGRKGGGRGGSSCGRADQYSVEEPLEELRNWSWKTLVIRDTPEKPWQDQMLLGL